MLPFTDLIDRCLQPFIARWADAQRPVSVNISRMITRDGSLVEHLRVAFRVIDHSL